jgi:sigma-B regulation protein RsbU (phosphoserine phosphatase)
MAETLTALNGKSCKEIVDGQLESVRAFAGEAEQSDDITILALKRKA